MLLIIACGNSLRQDDGAGLLLAERLAAKWEAAGWPVRHLAVQQLVPELALEIAEPDVRRVLFVDTRLAKDEMDTAVYLRNLDNQVNKQRLGHQVSPAVLLAYAYSLFGQQVTEREIFARQLTIPGFKFEHSECLTPLCQSILTRAVAQSSEIWPALSHSGVCRFVF